METDHPPRDKQAHLAKPSLWVAEPAGDLARHLRMPFEKMNPHFGMANTPKTTAC